jgi:hypothetical protein
MASASTNGICGIRPPLQGWNHPGEGEALGFPGRCPGLSSVCPFGAPTAGPISSLGKANRNTGFSAVTEGDVATISSSLRPLPTDLTRQGASAGPASRSSVRSPVAAPTRAAPVLLLPQPLLDWPRQRGRRRAEGALQLEPRATPWETRVPGHRGALKGRSKPCPNRAALVHDRPRRRRGRRTCRNVRRRRGQEADVVAKSADGVARSGDAFSPSPSVVRTSGDVERTSGDVAAPEASGRQSPRTLPLRLLPW